MAFSASQLKTLSDVTEEFGISEAQAINSVEGLYYADTNTVVHVNNEGDKPKYEFMKRQDYLAKFPQNEIRSVNGFPSDIKAGIVRFFKDTGGVGVAIAGTVTGAVIGGIASAAWFLFGPKDDDNA